MVWAFWWGSWTVGGAGMYHLAFCGSGQHSPQTWHAKLLTSGAHELQQTREASQGSEHQLMRRHIDVQSCCGRNLGSARRTVEAMSGLP